MRIELSEAQRQKEIFENITLTHIASVFIMIFALVLSKNIFAEQVFPSVNLYYLLFTFINLIIFSTVFFYLSRNTPSFKTFNWVDVLYIAFPLLIALSTLTIIRDSVYYTHSLLLLPVIIAASVWGKRVGLVVVGFASLSLLAYYYLMPGHGRSFPAIIEANMFFVSIMFIIGWYVGTQTDLETEHRLQLTSMANTDLLTGLYNHRYFQETLHKYFDPRNHTDLLTVIIIDIDYFKNYNDIYGHLAGDQLLSTMGEIISRAIPDGSFVARYGGDEFIVVMPGCTSIEGKSLAEEIRVQVESHPFPGEKYQPDGKITISCGIAGYPEHAATLKELLKNADQALYRVKSLEKNKVELYFSFFDNLETEENEKDLINSLRTLVAVIHARDRYTYGHSERITEWSLKIAQKMGLTEEEKQVARYAGFLHDVGKIEIDRSILNKDTPLNAEEWAIMQRHPEWGSEIVKAVPRLLPAASIILHHHENFDGSGYPHGLKGSNIPLLSRVIRVVDSYDAMVSQRPYNHKKRLPDAMQQLEAHSGSHYDPDILDLFKQVLHEEDHRS